MATTRDFTKRSSGAFIVSYISRGGRKILGRCFGLTFRGIIGFDSVVVLLLFIPFRFPRLGCLLNSKAIFAACERQGYTIDLNGCLQDDHCGVAHLMNPSLVLWFHHRSFPVA